MRELIRSFFPKITKEEGEGIAIIAFATVILLFSHHIKKTENYEAWALFYVTIYFFTTFAFISFIEIKDVPRKVYALALACAFFAFAAVLRFIPSFHGIFENTFITAATFVLCGVLLVPLFLAYDTREVGFRVGEVRIWLPIILVGIVVVIVGIIVAIHISPEFRNFYPDVRYNKDDLEYFVKGEVAHVLYMFSWEFLFRGFLLFSLVRRFGLLQGNLYQAMMFAFLHIGKPEVELYSSLVGGYLLGLLCFRVKTFYPAFIAHAIIFLSAEAAGFIVNYL